MHLAKKIACASFSALTLLTISTAHANEVNLDQGSKSTSPQVTDTYQWQTENDRLLIDLNGNSFKFTSGIPTVVSPDGRTVDTLPTSVSTSEGTAIVSYSVVDEGHRLVVRFESGPASVTDGMMQKASEDKNLLCFTLLAGGGAASGGLGGLIAGVAGAISACPGYHW